MSFSNFTGALRAYPCNIPPYVIPEHIRVPEYFKTAGCLAGQALDIAKRMMQPGVRTEDIDLAIYNFIIEQNAFPSPINYYGFPKASCISVNEVVCHGIPDGLVLCDGDVVNVDVTVYFCGMHGDFNQTFVVGDVSIAAAKTLCCAYAALKRALEVCRPGTPFKEIGRTIESTCREFGCSIVREYTGHGCGELFHSKPYVRHYCVESDKSVMEKGQVFTIEPMVNAGTAKVARWPDQWTVVTKDGKVSAAFERTLAITDNGYKILSSYDEQDDSP
uniref:Methionine aminopeptidase n=1 Tax=Dermatophagoides pteronyssinus TaxID=6956 RepID=A0A6P6Y7C0_DERPT|nr:methionine aminopeptidase 1-like [Dermatophagoides pteronyssinus]